MILFKLLFLLVTALFVNAKHSCTDEECFINSRLPNNTIPLHYNIVLDIFKKEDMFNGETNITIKILHNTRKISLHSLVRVYAKNTLLVHENKTIYHPTQFNRDGHILILTFDKTMSPGLYTLCFLKYSGFFFFETQGFLRLRNEHYWVNRLK